MNTRTIFTEQPEEEQWHMLLNFAYPNNINKFLAEKRITPPPGLADSVAGCITQAHEYFRASKEASLATSPMLAFYGAENLMRGVCALRSASVAAIMSHGMTITGTAAPPRIGDFAVSTFARTNTALAHFVQVFSSGGVSIPKSEWSILELLASIPELKDEFEACYPKEQALTIPVQMVKRRTDQLERIRPADLSRFPSPTDALTRVEGFLGAYLMPQISPQMDYIVLRRKLGSQEIGEFSISGQKFLSLAHLKGADSITLPPVIRFFLGLFGLGFISRYRPEVWATFVRNDSTGERHLIEKFVALSRRIVPNMCLSHIHESRIVFSKDAEGLLDLTKTISQDELKKMISDAAGDLRDGGKL